MKNYMTVSCHQHKFSCNYPCNPLYGINSVVLYVISINSSHSNLICKQEKKWNVNTQMFFENCYMPPTPPTTENTVSMEGSLSFTYSGNIKIQPSND